MSRHFSSEPRAQNQITGHTPKTVQKTIHHASPQRCFFNTLPKTMWVEHVQKTIWRLAVCEFPVFYGRRTAETSRVGADFGMVSGVTRRKAECSEEIVGNMSKSISPSASLAVGGDLYKELLLRLSCFVRCKSRDGTTLTGRSRS